MTNPFFRTIFVPEKLTTRLFIDILISTADEEEEERRRRSSSGSPFSPRLYSPENNTGIRFSARPPLLRPSRLTSWVAGGYWGSPAATPGDTGQLAACLSRASSQSSGFASASGICLFQHCCETLLLRIILIAVAHLTVLKHFYTVRKFLGFSKFSCCQQTGSTYYLPASRAVHVTE